MTIALALVLAAAASRGPVEPVAIVCAVSGQARVTVPGGGASAARLFQRLGAGASLDLPAGARLVLTFTDGKRYEVVGPSRVTLADAELAPGSGPAKRLSPVPPLPRLPKIRDDDAVGAAAGAVRVRDDRVLGLYPRRGAAALADAVSLRFRPAEGVGRYSVSLEDQAGRGVLALETAETTVSVPVGKLIPGKRYYWSVRGTDGAGWSVHGEAGFVTVDEETARARSTLRAVVAGSSDPASLALLAGVDRSLGLLAEAREGLRAAVTAAPEDAALRATLDELEGSLAHDDEP